MNLGLNLITLHTDGKINLQDCEKFYLAVVFFFAYLSHLHFLQIIKLFKFYTELTQVNTKCS